MIPVSEGFLRCLVEGGQRVSRLTTVDEDLNKGIRLMVSSGTMQMNGNDSIRRSLDCIAWSDEADIIPRSEDSIVHILGNQVFLESGWMVNGAPELVPCGVFVLRDIQVSRGANFVEVSINGLDRACKVQRETSRPVAIRPSSPLPVAVEDLVTSQYPEAKFNFPDEGTVFPPLLYETRADIWSEAIELVRSAGLTLFFDTIGQCSISGPFMDLNSTYDMDYFTTFPVSEPKRGLSADNLYNGVVVLGTNSGGATVSGSAYITDPRSEYRIDGPMGRVPKIIESEKVTTPVQANTMARAELRKMVALAEQLEMDVVCNPALDYGSIVRAEDPDSGIAGNWYILSYGMPLASTDPMHVIGGKVLGDVA